MSKFSSKFKDKFAKKENGRVDFHEEVPEDPSEDLEDDLGSNIDRERETSPPGFVGERSSPLQLQMREPPSPAVFQEEESPPSPRFQAPSPPGRPLRDPVPTPRTPTQAEVTQEALENILQSASPREPPPSPDSPPDSGISLASPNRQMITSTLFDRFSASPTRPSQLKEKHKPKSPEKEKPSFSKIFGGDNKGHSMEDEFEGPPRVRRPSREGKHYASATITSQTQPLSIQTLTQTSPRTPTTTSWTAMPSAPPLPPQTLLRPARPPPLPLSAMPTLRSFANPPISRGQSHPPEYPEQATSAQPPIYAITAPALRPIYAERTRLDDPRGQESQGQQGQPQEFSSPYSEISWSQQNRGEPQGGSIPPYSHTPRSRPYEELGLPPAEEAPRRHGLDPGRHAPDPGRNVPDSGRKPMSAASAVAELLSSRQPVSLRIHIQKHKTETSYKKSQTFGPASRPAQGSSQPKKNGTGFTESSI